MDRGDALAFQAVGHPWLRSDGPASASTHHALAHPQESCRQRLQRFHFAHDKVGSRLSKGDDPLRADFMTYVCRYNDDQKGMSRAEIDATFEILVSASSETTATALTGTLHYLLGHPKQFAQLRKEIREAFQSSDEITMEGTARLEYLKAVINEGLRLCPPTPTMLPRLVPRGGANICGHWVPAGVRPPPFHDSLVSDHADASTNQDFRRCTTVVHVPRGRQLWRSRRLHSGALAEIRRRAPWYFNRRRRRPETRE